ncbi:Glycerol uptake facilitator protein [Patulibacter medicamentivorans]|uniref:Glycerol uptake facilitator protein n=1 Tax=Patulibacter medicamentivorans TaxID=1097667 RepID=H0E0H9_9ACTN|nr:MIP family channel protein [Patulibacter medicamentivorans]EHN12798.1 Glycerol uptake facilitator protein [Patulibacter medicamentivorans]
MSTITREPPPAAALRPAPVRERIRRRADRLRATFAGELVAELAGTFVLMALINGVVAAAVVGLTESGRTQAVFQASGDWMLIAWGAGFAVVFAIYVAGGVTGAHLNPAITLAMAARRGFPWRKVPAYWAVQVIGAFLGAALIYWNYHDAINAFEAAHHITRGSADSAATFGIWGTTPAPYFTSWFGPFLDQVIGTAFLVGLVLAVVDEHNLPPKGNLSPFLIGLIVVVIGIAFGPNAGYAINPARDLGPRILAWFEGWGSVALPGNYGNVDAYMWIPILGPLVGGLIGAFAYDGVIRKVLIARKPPARGVQEHGRVAEDL